MISVVIPALNEEHSLPETIRHVMAQDGAFEVIVVDGGSIDATVKLAAAAAVTRIVHARTGRATQMNAGAAAARGEWLLFLHADTWLPEGALAAIRASHPACRSGGFRHRFRPLDWRLALVSWVDNLRCRHTSIIYGDQALFVRRSEFTRLGGFDESATLEDVAFCERLRQTARPVLLDLVVQTDSRKFLRLGVWRSLARIATILTRHELGLRVSRSDAFFEDVR